MFRKAFMYSGPPADSGTITSAGLISFASRQAKRSTRTQPLSSTSTFNAHNGAKPALPRGHECRRTAHSSCFPQVNLDLTYYLPVQLCCIQQLPVGLNYQGANRKFSCHWYGPKRGCSVSPPNMYLAQKASGLSHGRSQAVVEDAGASSKPNFQSTICLQVIAIGYALAPFDDCGGLHRSAIAAATPYGGCRGSRAALRRVGFSAQELDSCSVRWRSGLPRIAEPLVLSSGCWVHEGFQMLSAL